MNKMIGLIQKLAISSLFVACATAGNPVLAIGPVLDLDADDSRVVGIGYLTTMEGAPTSVTDDVLITDDGNKISRAIITIINPKPGDQLLQSDLEGQLIFDPSSTDTELVITGLAPLEKYGTALESITFFNDCAVCDGTPRFISIFVEDPGGESSNTALTTIDNVLPPDPDGDPPSGIRGFIYTTVRDALSQVHLDGAVVSINESENLLEVFELDDQYVLHVYPGIYTVNASLPSYISSSVGNVSAEFNNDPSSPVQINLYASVADGDVVPDGHLNAGDFLVALRIVLGQKDVTPAELARGDMNGDGDITLPDLILILQAVQSAP